MQLSLSHHTSGHQTPDNRFSGFSTPNPLPAKNGCQKTDIYAFSVSKLVNPVRGWGFIIPYFMYMSLYFVTIFHQHKPELGFLTAHHHLPNSRIVAGFPPPPLPVVTPARPLHGKAEESLQCKKISKQWECKTQMQAFINSRLSSGKSTGAIMHLTPDGQAKLQVKVQSRGRGLFAASNIKRSA